MLITTAVLQVFHLNQAMRHFPASMVVPVYYITFTIASISGGGIVFGDFRWTREESDRYKAGLRLVMAGFQSMSEGDCQEATDGVQRLKENWGSMDSSERETWLLGIREGLDDWRRSGDVELPAPHALWIGIGTGQIDVPD